MTPSPDTLSVVVQLNKLGYRARIWQAWRSFGGMACPDQIEITDLETAATVYCPENFTLNDCLTAIAVKNESFRRAEQLTNGKE